jgi:hypothetical protein
MTTNLNYVEFQACHHLWCDAYGLLDIYQIAEECVACMLRGFLSPKVEEAA